MKAGLSVNDCRPSINSKLRGGEKEIMKKVLLALVAVTTTAAVVGYAAAAFTDSANAEDNLFQAGTLDLQLSQDGSTWAEDTNDTWVSPTNWAPGDSFDDVLYLRDAGTVDIDSLQWNMSDRTRTGSADLDDMVVLTSAWYDDNGNDVRDGGEGILSSLVSAYDLIDVNGEVSLEELYDGMTGGVGAYELEAGANVLPGEVTDPLLGGPSGTGKGLYLEWTFDEDADNTYQGTTVLVDFDFTGSNVE